MSFEFGDVVLVPFPFTNQIESKKRPAVVVSSRSYNSVKPDLIVMAVTSQLRPSPEFGEAWISRWQEAGLLKPSAVKPVFATLEQNLVIRQLGRLVETDQLLLTIEIRKILGEVGSAK
jgi:mRNA interferase MazF